MFNYLDNDDHLLRYQKLGSIVILFCIYNEFTLNLYKNNLLINVTIHVFKFFILLIIGKLLIY